MERAELEKWRPKEVARLLALVETERRYYQEIVASLPVSLLIVGQNLTAVSANRQFRMRVGRKSEEILGRPLSELLPIDGLDSLVEQVLQSGVGTPKQEFQWDGKTVVVTALPLRSWEEESEAESLVVLEERTETRPALTAEQQKAIEVSAQVEGMLWEVDYAAGGITYASEGALALFGYPVERWLSDKSVWGLRVAEADRARVDAFYDQIGSSEGLVFSIEFSAVHAAGRLFLARETVRVTRDDQGRPLRLVGLTTDITERRELDNQQSLARKGEALQRLSAKLAHDLNNLLMIVAGYGEELKNSLPDTHPLHQDMKEILNATERLYGLTTQFQNYTRKPVLTPAATTVSDLLAQIRPSVEEALGSGGTFVAELPAGLAHLKIDASQIAGAFTSLARQCALGETAQSNLKLTASNVLRGESNASGEGLQAGAYVRLTLEQQQSWPAAELLEPWLQSDDRAREVELGVAEAYQILRQSGGDLSVDGRCLHLYLPVASESDITPAQAPAAPKAEAVSEPEPTLETILVVEDEGGIRALVRKILKRQGYEVLEASGGEEALQVLENSSTRVDLLLTDVMMPGMNGVELSQRALTRNAALKVLFVSGYTDESVLEAGQFPAGTAFLQKPFTLGSLLGKVREVLDSGAARQAAS